MVVTKIELYNLLKEKIGEVQAKTLAELESKIANAKVDIIRWLIATNVALAGLMIAAVKLMM
ncbi:MAG: hypothetical protein KF900_08550 [Bacteroidetes bacterium]|nr:hypothetical protein [Bacteroidota bacterium]